MGYLYFSWDLDPCKDPTRITVDHVHVFLSVIETGLGREFFAVNMMAGVHEWTPVISCTPVGLP